MQEIPETVEPPDRETRLLLRWRQQTLERAGYPVGDAAELAAHVEVDLHGAVELLEAGCPLPTALKILL